MGCVSAAPVAPKHKKPGQSGAKPTNVFPQPNQMVLQFRDDLQKLSQGVSYVPKTDAMVPVVAVGERALPIAIAPLCLEAGDPTGVSLGIAAVAHYERGRVLCVGQINFIVECTSENAEAAVFLENAVRWAAPNVMGTIRVCLLGLSASIAPQIQKNLGGFGFHVSLRDEPTDLERFNVILCSSDCKFGVELREALKRGAGLICGAAEAETPNRFAMNSLLVEAGLGFPQCFLVVGPLNASTVKLTLSYTAMSKITLKSQAARFEEMVKGKDINQIDVGELDNVISALRYHIGVMFQEKNEILEHLADIALEALENSNCYENGVFCSTLVQSVFVALITDLMMKLPASYFAGKDHSQLFPGPIGIPELVTETISVNYTNDGWFTTGMYLPAGHVAKVAVTGDVTETMAIQVGSHTEVLSTGQSGLLRWPSVVNIYRIGPEEFEIGSMFGGIVYLVNDAKGEGCVNITFTDVCKYPLWSEGGWNGTETLEAPVMEIVTSYVVFTMPREYMEKIPDVSEFVMNIDSFIENVVHFTSYVPDKPFRVVFDVELPVEGPICGYPIVLSYETIDNIINNQNPTPGLFIMLMYIGILSLPADFFEDDIEASLATTATGVTFLKHWPDLSPLDYVTIPLPAMFSEIWAIYLNERDKGLITRVLRRTRMRPPGKFDMWQVFVTELNKCSEGKDYGHLMPKRSDKSPPSESVVMCMSSTSLQSYQLDDQDIFHLK